MTNNCSNETIPQTELQRAISALNQQEMQVQATVKRLEYEKNLLWLAEMKVIELSNAALIS